MKTIGFTSDENIVLIKTLKEEIKKLEDFNSIGKQLVSPVIDKSIRTQVRVAIKTFENIIFKIENLTNI
tara:strand:- start:1404 stop:1610 length:207 start_codon:yes stop_codon:yes gene_type:complete